MEDEKRDIDHVRESLEAALYYLGQAGMAIHRIAEHPDNAEAARAMFFQSGQISGALQIIEKAAEAFAADDY